MGQDITCSLVGATHAHHSPMRLCARLLLAHRAVRCVHTTHIVESVERSEGKSGREPDTKIVYLQRRDERTKKKKDINEEEAATDTHIHIHTLSEQKGIPIQYTF